jgi:hypothetical protein
VYATRRRLPGGAALLIVPAAALVVHQARYSLAYGARANAQLAAQGHSYLHSLVPWTVLALGAGLAAFVRRAAHAHATGESGRAASLGARVLWLLTTAGLVALYALQETLEGTFATGHPSGIDGVFGHGGWWAVPVAAVVAVAVVALLSLARTLLRLVAASHRRVVFRVAPVLLPQAPALVRVAPLARAAAGRAPPRLHRPV